MGQLLANVLSQGGVLRRDRIWGRIIGMEGSVSEQNEAVVIDNHRTYLIFSHKIKFSVIFQVYKADWFRVNLI